MDNNNIHNHICNNNHRRMERQNHIRIENETISHKEDNNYNNSEYPQKNDREYCSGCEHMCENEHGGEVYSLNVEKTAYKNKNFRTSVWTGRYLQMTLMSIPYSSEIGVEMHTDTDQYIRIEHGYAILLTGDDSNCLNNKKKICTGDAVFIPAGTWHNIINIGKCELKLSSIYAPPHHPKCTEQRYKYN